MMKTYNQMGLIGCGLMGGSLALALKQARVVKSVVGYSKSPSTTARAKAMGVIDLEAKSAMQACAGSDLIVVAVPVSAISATFKSIRQFVQADVLTLDVGSTKQDVVKNAEKFLGWNAQYFVPAHPITGKEVSGVDHAEAGLYRGSNVVLTPTPATDLDKVQEAQALWAAVGGRVHVMSPSEHDAVMAGVSHLPHLVAFAFMNGLLAQSDYGELMKLAGPGFRDFSRIAAGDPVLWRDVLMANRTEVMGQLRQLVLSMQAFQKALHDQDGDALEQLVKKASKARNEWRS